MKATRTRKKGCPFCKAKPDSLWVSFFGDEGGWAAIVCVGCSTRGPKIRIEGSISGLAEGVDEAWSKWNQRG
jgi:hypothetical protein